MRFASLFLLFLFPLISFSQNGYGNQWIFGSFNDPPPASTILNFNGDTVKIEPIEKPMELEGSCAIMCDSAGKLLFYSNGCYIANATHQMMANGDSIGKNKLETSFCKTGGNPLNQGIIALPKPGSDHLFYLFYTDIGDPYFMQPFFPLAPITMYYSVIDMNLEGGLGAVVEKNMIIIQDTFALSMIQANRHNDGNSWWVLMPKSHSNCYWTLRLTENGIDTIFKQCIGPIWIDNDPQGQAVFSPNSKYYVRANYFYGLNIFNFDNSTGMFSNPINISFGQDTFYFNGTAFSQNSRFIYTSAYSKLWQFDMWTNDISASRTLIAELNTPSNIQVKTYFNQARLASDGKIYIGGTSAFKHMHIINRPNCPGQECDLIQYALEMAGRSRYTMPNMPHYKQWNEGDTCETVNVTTLVNQGLHPAYLYPNPANESTTLVIREGKQGNVQIVNALGQVILTQKVTSILTYINLRAIGIGTYYVNIVYSDGQREILKLVIVQ